MVFSDFSVIGFPETDDPANMAAPCVYYHKNPTAKFFDRAGRHKARLAVVDALIGFFDKRPFENQCREIEWQAALSVILGTFHRIELE
jgi:hypothetical protein